LGYNENQHPTFFLKPNNHKTKDITCGNIKETPKEYVACIAFGSKTQDKTFRTWKNANKTICLFHEFTNK
jgi:hypothetical protein